jgi:P-type Cu2+ transporter
MPAGRGSELEAVAGMVFMLIVIVQRLRYRGHQIGHHGFRGDEQTGHRGGALEGRAHHLGRIDDTHRQQIAILVRLGVVTVGVILGLEELGWLLAPSLSERARTLEASGHSVIYVGWADRVHAVLSLDDTPLPEAGSTVEALRGLGLEVALLTGDLAHAARRIGAVAGIEDIQAGLTPEAKRAALDRYRGDYRAVAMVGDGLNDGPVLAEADVGIAVGSATDLARETANLVLPLGGLWMLPWVISVARMVRLTILTNLLWAFGYNLIALTLAVAGLLQPILAAAIMASSSLLLVVNSLRLSRLPDPVQAPVGPPRRRAGQRLPWRRHSDNGRPRAGAGLNGVITAPKKLLIRGSQIRS